MAKRTKQSPPAIGDNSSVNDADARLLKGFTSELLRLADDEEQIKIDRSNIFASVKEKGFHVSALREVIKEKRMDGIKRKRLEAKERAKDAYRLTLGMLNDTPLGQAAVAREFSDADAPRQAMGS